jgi:hypothetical protein
MEFNGTYIHITHPADFEITRQGQDRMWAALAKACMKHDCHKVLSECPAPPKRQMTTTDAFMSASQTTKIKGLLLACWFQDYTPDSKTDFFKLAANNRGAKVDFFNSRESALNWLGIRDEEQ